MRMKGKLPIFTKRDAWNMDETLAPIITAGLKEFKKGLEESTCQGYPDGLNGMDEWSTIIDKMIYSFEHLKIDSPECVLLKYRRSIESTMKNILEDSVKKKIWDDYLEESKEYAEVVQEGFEDVEHIGGQVMEA